MVIDKVRTDGRTSRSCPAQYPGILGIADIHSSICRISFNAAAGPPSNGWWGKRRGGGDFCRVHMKKFRNANSYREVSWQWTRIELYVVRPLSSKYRFGRHSLNCRWKLNYSSFCATDPAQLQIQIKRNFLLGEDAKLLAKSVRPHMTAIKPSLGGCRHQCHHKSSSLVGQPLIE